MRVLILLLSIFVVCWQATAKEHPCTKAEAIEAENSVSQLENWQDVYRSFKKFSHCDDGAIAEGYSQTVVTLLAKHWDRLDELTKIVSSDSDFFRFILHHIDTTTDMGDIEKILSNSSNQCPASGKSLCPAIEKTARKVLREFKKKKK